MCFEKARLQPRRKGLDPGGFAAEGQAQNTT
jgi:hypothetical protein